MFVILGGAQSEIFKSKGGFVELGHFNETFFKNARKKDPQGKILELFLLETLKTTFWMEDLTPGWAQLVSFFLKSVHFFDFWKKLKEASPPLPTVTQEEFSTDLPRFIIKLHNGRQHLNWFFYMSFQMELNLHYTRLLYYTTLH